MKFLIFFIFIVRSILGAPSLVDAHILGKTYFDDSGGYKMGDVSFGILYAGIGSLVMAFISACIFGASLNGGIKKRELDDLVVGKPGKLNPYPVDVDGFYYNDVAFVEGTPEEIKLLKV